MPATDPHQRLMQHLSTLGMGYPPREALLEILRENFSADEAELACRLPAGVPPFATATAEDVARSAGRPVEAVRLTLEALARRGLVYRASGPDGRPGYGFLQVGFGFPQTFFWKGEDSAHARRMAELVARYFSRDVTREAYAGSDTKPYRYVPVRRSLSPRLQTVYPHHAMEPVLEGATVFAVGHCPCRVSMRLRGRPCPHPEEVCLKFDEMAEYVIHAGLARRIDRDEAREIVRRSAGLGLVHFVDNARDGVHHNCNCCGCSCWNVGTIRRRKVPRDVLMAVYFLRDTDPEGCTGCGACVEVCPVDAVDVEDDVARVDRAWCIGCGVCVDACPEGAVRLEPRPGRGEVPQDFGTLHRTILDQKKARRAS